MRCAVLDIRTVSAAELARWEAAAEPERRARWQQFRRPEDRARSICADHLARTLLREAGAEEPAIRTGTNGKPYVPDGPAFNCSHSGNFVCCAVHGGPVGIDLEARRPVRAALAARICTPEELVFAAPGGVFDPLRFLQLWTAKEAWVKYTGEGLGVDFRTLPAAAEDGLHETLFGRRRPLPELKASNRVQRAFGERVAMNAVYDAV